MTTLRWLFTDTETHETYRFALNPNAMTPPPLVQKQFSFGSLPKRRGGGITAAAVRTSVPAQPWEFSGVSRSKAHHDALTAWAQRDAVIRVDDHLGRAFEVVLLSFTPTDKRSSQVAWRQDFVMKTLLLRRVA